MVALYVKHREQTACTGNAPYKTCIVVAVAVLFEVFKEWLYFGW